MSDGFLSLHEDPEPAQILTIALVIIDGPPSIYSCVSTHGSFVFEFADPSIINTYGPRVDQHRNISKVAL
jgi:hypothetical protein